MHVSIINCALPKISKESKLAVVGYVAFTGTYSFQLFFINLSFGSLQCSKLPTFSCVVYVVCSVMYHFVVQKTVFFAVKRLFFVS